METQQQAQPQFQDKIVMESVINSLSYMDRLRIFIGYPIAVKSEIVTQNIVGNCQGITIIQAVSPLDAKTYKAT